METTYLCKFDEQGRREETYLTCEYTDEQKSQMIADGYIEISEEEWNYYVGNNGEGVNGTGYVRDPETGRPVDAPPYVPSKEAQLAQLDAQYDSDKAEIMSYFTQALFAGDTDEQEQLKAEMDEIDAQYIADREAIEEA